MAPPTITPSARNGTAWIKTPVKIVTAVCNRADAPTARASGACSSSPTTSSTASA